MGEARRSAARLRARTLGPPCGGHRSALSPENDLAAIAAAYAEDGWRVDAALIETIAAAGTREELVARASGALYRPWVDALARRFRAAVEAAGAAGRPAPLLVEPGTMVLFVDGMRMDVGRAVVERLIELGAPATRRGAWRPCRR